MKEPVRKIWSRRREMTGEEGVLGCKKIWEGKRKGPRRNSLR